MEDTTAEPPHAAPARYAHWAEPTWREQTYSLSLLPEAEGGEILKRMAGGWRPADGWSLAPAPMPYIPLASFTGREAMEATLTRWMQRICQTLPRFSLPLGDAALLPDRSLRMRVTDTESLRRLIERLEVLETYIKSCGTGQVEWVRNPYCRLGRAVASKGDAEVPAIEAGKTSQARFPVHCLLLGKKTHTEDGSEKVYLCPFPP
jgi:hypothetical protein